MSAYPSDLPSPLVTTTRKTNTTATHLDIKQHVKIFQLRVQRSGRAELYGVAPASGDDTDPTKAALLPSDVAARRFCAPAPALVVLCRHLTDSHVEHILHMRRREAVPVLALSPCR